MSCPCCGAAELGSDTRDMSYTYKGEATTVPAVTGDLCAARGEVVLTREPGNRYSEFIGSFRRQMLLDPVLYEVSAWLALHNVR